MWHGLPAREITAKMAVPPIKQLRLNTYHRMRLGKSRRANGPGSRTKGLKYISSPVSPQNRWLKLRLLWQKYDKIN